MKKLFLFLLFLELFTISVYAKECKLIITPSDFQLDDRLRAPNESYMFSAVGNYGFIQNMQGFTQSIFCAGLTNGDMEIARACGAEVAFFIEKDSVKLNGSRIGDVFGKNAADGYKLSGKAPITKEHLCSIQKKYKTDMSWSRSSLVPMLEEHQEKIRKKYLEASKTVGQSENVQEIMDTIEIITNKE